MLAKFQALIREVGTVDALCYGLARLLTQIGLGELHRYVLVAQPVPAEPAQRRPSGRVEIRQIAEKDYDLAWFPRPEEVVRQRYAQGAVCFVAFLDQAPIGCIWLVLGSYLEDEVRCRFMLTPVTETAWDFDVFLHPRHRLGRGFAYLWEAANDWLRCHHRHWTLSRIDAFNQASLRAHRRRGATVVAQALFLRIGPAQICLSSRPPYCHLSVHDADLPALWLSPPSPKRPHPEA